MGIKQQTAMRDRLEELRQKAQESPDPETEVNLDPLSGVGDPDDPVEVGIASPQAVVFEEEPIVENFLSEVQRIRDEISDLDAEVRHDHCFFPQNCIGNVSSLKDDTLPLCIICDTLS